MEEKEQKEHIDIQKETLNQLPKQYPKKTRNYKNKK